MDIRRVVLYSAFVLVAYSLWTHWQTDYPPASQPLITHDAVQESDPSDQLLPKMVRRDSTLTEKATSFTKESKDTQTISVKTDVLHLTIDLEHGDIIQAKLLDYPVSVEEKNQPFTLLQDNENERYVANSSLFVVEDQSVKTLRLNYQAEKDHYELSSDQASLTVALQGYDSNGLQVKKEFVFHPSSYLIDVRYRLMNQASTPWEGYLNTQLLRTTPVEDKSSIFHIGSFTGASYSQPGHHRYQKVPFKDMNKANLDVETQGGWIAMQQHYFLSAWIPDEQSQNRFYTRTYKGDYTIGSVSAPITLAPEQHQDIGSRLYLGPEITSVLKSIAPGLDMTVDYGWLWFLSSLLFSFMKAIYSVVGNWGWSIVLVTLFIKLAFYRLSATSYKSMAGMRKLQPKLQALRERYGDDKAKISQATMEMYRQEKVNPLGGCLPIIVQIPVFIALYWVLLESVELRQAPFIFWIKDLAAPDPYHVLPVIMGLTMLIQQKLNPAPPDPMQAKVMMFLPVLFTALFWNFPSGLVLYWIVNNTLSILQQWYITRKYSDDKPSSSKLIPAK